MKKLVFMPLAAVATSCGNSPGMSTRSVTDSSSVDKDGATSTFMPLLILP